jgi:hypothetical protein
MTSRRLAGCLVALAVMLVWLHSLGIRLPYMDQVPVFDADCTTSEASMWARMWWDEGALKMWFSTPLAPPSIEAPVRTLYESWPPGTFVPIYLIARLLGVEPNIPMVNWINTSEHGLIALAAAFIAFNIALTNRLGKIASALIAIGVTLPILLSRGPIYVFSQIYDTTNAVLIYITAFIMLETLFYSVQSARDKWIITALQLATIFVAFAVDWLSYTVFAFWLLTRLAASYLGVEARMTFRNLVGFILVPVVGFMLYLVWRFGAPGSLARSDGIVASLDFLKFKILERMNIGEVSHITGFSNVFFGEMHSLYYSNYAFLLIAGSALLTLLLVVIAFRRARDPDQRRAVFATGSILFLVTVPFYAHMLILYQHTFIHRWAIMKAMFAYALVPFALLPIVIFTLVRLSVGENKSWRRFGQPALGLALALCAIFYAERIATEHYFPLGRVNRTAYLMWDDIGRNTRYQDVVVSPVLEANPISAQVGASYKLVHLAMDFGEVDKLVDRVCGDFNVVLALPEGAEAGAFATREPSEVVDTGRIRLLRFAHYQGKRVSCS